jgi:hypothetical protein
LQFVALTLIVEVVGCGGATVGGTTFGASEIAVGKIKADVNGFEMKGLGVEVGSLGLGGIGVGVIVDGAGVGVGSVGVGVSCRVHDRGRIIFCSGWFLGMTSRTIATFWGSGELQATIHKASKKSGATSWRCTIADNP